MVTETQAPATVIDFDESMTTGTLTKVKEPSAEEIAAAAEAEKAKLEADKKKAEDDAKNKDTDDEEEEEEEEDDDKKPADDQKLTEEEKAAAEAEKAKKKDEPEDDGSVGADEFIKAEYFEKYEVENKEQLDELLETASEILSENEKLKKELESKKDLKPKFASEHEEKAFELLKSFASLADGASAIATLITMDVDKADPKRMLQTQFLIEHPEISAKEADEQFERLYKRKYTVKDKDKFDSEEDYEDAKKDAETDLKIDGERSKKFLRAKQEEVRTKSQEKATPEDKKVPEVILKSIERNADEFTKHADGFKELIFSPTDNDSDDFTFKFKPEQVKAIKNSTLDWVNNPAMYDDKGKFKTKFDPETALRLTSYAMFGDDIFGSLVDHMHTLKNITRADEIGKKKITDKSKQKGDPGDLNEYDQAEHLAKKMKIKRGQ